jgi:hypothetical protein
LVKSPVPSGTLPNPAAAIVAAPACRVAGSLRSSAARPCASQLPAIHRTAT